MRLCYNEKSHPKVLFQHSLEFRCLKKAQPRSDVEIEDKGIAHSNKSKC